MQNKEIKMKNKRIMGMFLLAGCVALSMATLGWSEEDERWERGGDREHGFWQQTSGVAPVTNKAYQNECSACHFAYPAGFLPERSWVKIMNTLDKHFGDNAELDQKTMDAITVYLRGNAADHVPNRFSRSLLRSVPADATPLRISKTPYFQHKHREIPARMVSGNPKVRSFSNCVSCHTMAEKGNFDEHGVRIPGFAAWED